MMRAKEGRKREIYKAIHTVIASMRQMTCGGKL